MKKVVIVSVLIIVVLGTALASGAAAYGSRTAERIASEPDIRGCSIAYYENNEIVFQNYGDGINEQSVFELASNGKTVGAYIALKMVDEGKLDLDDKIFPFLDLLTKRN